MTALVSEMPALSERNRSRAAYHIESERSSNRPELIKQMTDVLDEIIPAIPVDDGISALVTRIGECILKAAAEKQASYETLLAAASAEMGAITKERTRPSIRCPGRNAVTNL
jgi:hypothetical protein